MSNSRDDENQPEAKRWKGENENESISASGSRTVREPRILISLMMITNGGNTDKKLLRAIRILERASHDLRAVITTYEGKHNHDVPAASDSGSYTMNRLHINTNNELMAIRLSTGMMTNFPNSIQRNRDTVDFAYLGFGDSIGPYIDQMQQTDNALSMAEEPKDDSFF
ncbi:probable WRKY transcription factor 33 [Olea europaea subsp. europaea]|uniref:Probable WRKY transcription factor 33 n=1 Tax=Olea europaea subsp. europaea TaxID=158383 RepID=A0A8S0RKW2_OLEEU|nr:probable WRKY transcription factor 33 [Olea europaea subsp. europaea]